MVYKLLQSAFRSIFANRFYSVMTVLGLSIGMASALLLFIYVTFESGYDRMFPASKNIYRVFNENYTNGKIDVRDANSHSAVGPAMKALLPEVVDYTRIYTMANQAISVRAGSNVSLLRKAYVVDEGFLRMFPFEQQSHSSSALLKKPYSIVLTEDAAARYFGNINPVGQTLELNGAGMEGTYTVNAVINNLPVNTHFDFEVLISYATKYARGHEDNWDNYWDYNYLQLAEGADVNKVRQVLQETGKKHISATSMVLNIQPLVDIHLRSDLTYELTPNGDYRIVNVILLIGISILVVACVNHLNLSSARTIVRGKEVAIKKILGSTKWQLSGQFLIESALLNFLALLLAIAIAQLTWPLFERVTGSRFTLDDIPGSAFWILPVLFFSSMILSGVYPSLTLSSLNTQHALKGKTTGTPTGSTIRRLLITFQFTVSVALISGSYIILHQTNHLLSQPLGIDISQTVVIQAPLATEQRGKMEVLRNELLSIPGIKGVASSSVVPGQNLNTIAGTSEGMWREGDSSDERITYYYYDVDDKFFRQHDVQLMDGRHFDENTKARDEVMINESALNAFGFESAAKATNSFILYGRQREHRLKIIGVVKDFHIQSLKHAAAPTLYYHRGIDENSLISVKFDAADPGKVMTAIQDRWRRIFPDEPFDYNFEDQAFGRQYSTEQKFSLLTSMFSISAIVIACIGLFGLTSFTTLQRTKEIGIRKVMGANVVQVVKMLSGDVLKLVLLGALIAIPLINYLGNAWLSAYASRISLTWTFFVAPIILTCLIALMTVLVITTRAASQNPINAIRYE